MEVVVRGSDSRMTKAFDLLAEFAKFGRERQMSLQDPGTFSAFIGHVGREVEGALGDSTLLFATNAVDV